MYRTRSYQVLSSSRCWYRAREHVHPRGSRLEYVQRVLVSYFERSEFLIDTSLSTYQGGVRFMYHIRTTWHQLVCTWYEPAPKIRICRYLCTRASLHPPPKKNRRPIDEIAPKKQNKNNLNTELTEMGVFSAVAGNQLPCLLYTSPSPRDKRQSRMPSSA